MIENSENKLGLEKFTKKPSRLRLKSPRLVLAAIFALAGTGALAKNFDNPGNVESSPSLASDLSWSKETNELICPMSNMAHAKTARGIIAAGGSNLEGADCSESPLYSNWTVIKDKTTGSWTRLPDLPQRSTNGAATEIKVGPYAGSFLYSGGEGIENATVTTLNKVWALKPDNTWVALPDLPTPRQGHRVETMGKNVVFAGGYADDGVTKKSAVVLDTETMTYFNIPDMTDARTDFGSTIGPGGRMIVSGGHDGANNLDTIEIAKPDLSGWEKKSNLLKTRWGHEIVYDTLTGKLISLGGKVGLTNETDSSVEEYDLTTGVREFNQSFITPRVSFLAQMNDLNQIIMAGGDTVIIPSKLKSAEKGSRNQISSPTPTRTSTPVAPTSTPTPAVPTATPSPTQTPDRPVIRPLNNDVVIPVSANNSNKITQP